MLTSEELAYIAKYTSGVRMYSIFAILRGQSSLAEEDPGLKVAFGNTETEGGFFNAGIVDGEGSIGLITAMGNHRPVKRRNSRSAGKENPGHSLQTRMKVSVGMTERSIPEWLCSEFGGYLFYREHPQTNWKPRCDWTATSNIAARFLEAILPYLRIKKVPAEIALAFQKKRVRGHPLSDVQRQADEILHLSLRELNRRGVEQVK